ncbi:MAG: hypothetical protein M9928_14470 [Anaerolineae bacterium]|nr:hypothetical protein [Anaerolineae bacterium]
MQNSTQQPPDMYAQFKAWAFANGFADVGLPLPGDTVFAAHGESGLYSAILTAGDLRVMQAIHAYAHRADRPLTAQSIS